MNGDWFNGGANLNPLALRHIGNARRDAELLVADFGEHRDAGADLLDRRAREADPQPTPAMCRVGRPFRPWIDRDAGGERGRIEFHGVDLIGQLDPEKDAALRIIELGGGAELLVEARHQGLELGAQPATQPRYV